MVKKTYIHVHKILFSSEKSLHVTDVHVYDITKMLCDSLHA